MNINLQKSKLIIDKSKRILVFTGAGISSESGIPTFRDLDGIWKDYNPFLWATKLGLYWNYIFRFKKFKKFLIDVLNPIALSAPNAGHFSLTDIEQQKDVFILTQNIDNLHQEAGCKNVYEIHGNIFEIRKKYKVFKKYAKHEYKQLIENIQNEDSRIISRKSLNDIICFKKGIRPNVVLFNEKINVHAYNKAIAYIKKCDCLLVVGTSLSVYPAANVVEIAQLNHIPVINIGFSKLIGVININGKSSEILPKLLR